MFDDKLDLTQCKWCRKALPEHQIRMMSQSEYSRWFREGYCSFACFQKHDSTPTGMHESHLSDPEVTPNDDLKAGVTTSAYPSPSSLPVIHLSTARWVIITLVGLVFMTADFFVADGLFSGLSADPKEISIGVVFGMAAVGAIRYWIWPLTLRCVISVSIAALFVFCLLAAYFYETMPYRTMRQMNLFGKLCFMYDRQDKDLPLEYREYVTSDGVKLMFVPKGHAYTRWYETSAFVTIDGKGMPAKYLKRGLLISVE